MLKRILLSCICVFAFSAAFVQADPKDDIKSAVQKLADSPSYSWTTTTQGGFMRGPQTGQTEKDGYTSVTMKMRDSSFDIIIKGDKSAIKTDSGWKSGAELMEATNDDAGGPPPPERFAAMFAQNFKTPVEQAMDNIDGLQNIQKTDTGFTADMTPETAKKMLTFRPRRPTTNPDNAGNAPPQFEVSDAKGSVKLTVKDGMLSQLEFHLTGTVSFNGNDRDVDRTTTVDFKDIGSTKVTVPDEAKAKLSS